MWIWTGNQCPRTGGLNREAQHAFLLGAAGVWRATEMDSRKPDPLSNIQTQKEGRKSHYTLKGPKGLIFSMCLTIKEEHMQPHGLCSQLTYP